MHLGIDWAARLREHGALYANVWQCISDGEQFLGMPWRTDRRFCIDAVLADQPPPYCKPKYRLVGVLHVRPKEQPREPGDANNASGRNQ
jgi:hypothetical protein